MKIHDKEVSLEELVSEMNPSNNLRKDYGKGIYLSSEEYKILERYHFLIQNYSNIKSLIFDIEEYLNENYEVELEDLEMVADNLKELDYYQNTNQ